LDAAGVARERLDEMINPALLLDCDRRFCVSAYPLCHSYGIYSVDALYLKVALERGAVLASLDKEDFTDRIRAKNPPIEVYHVSEFPY
jgi:predicted nucleic acid-binding protein